MGTVGLVFSFGDSVGVPGTAARLPLPLDLVRELVPPFKAFRGAWRFSWLMVVAVSWWSAVGMEQLLAKYSQGARRWLAPLSPLVLLFLLSLPAAVPGLKVPLDGRPGLTVSQRSAVLTLPAPATEYDEDRTEALWLARTLTTGQPVTGGATGWVPPEIRELRTSLLHCEEGKTKATDLLAEMKKQGIVWAEIALRPGDQKRIGFWRDALREAGAVRDDVWPQAGYEMYRLSER